MSKAKCTCPAYNFCTSRPKRCKHITEVASKGCFWKENGPLDSPTFITKVRNKRGGVISAIGITFTSFRNAPMFGLKECPNCEGLTVTTK
jgi:hypothetical protein